VGRHGFIAFYARTAAQPLLEEATLEAHRQGIGLHSGAGVDDELDAFRHAYAAAVVAHTIGEAAAVYLGDLYELGTENTDEQQKMDEFNNKFGARIGATTPDRADIPRRIAEEGVRMGGLITSLEDPRITRDGVLIPSGEATTRGDGHGEFLP